VTQKSNPPFFVTTSSNIGQFSKFFTGTLSMKILPYLKRVAALPCEILASENWRFLCTVADQLKDK